MTTLLHPLSEWIRFRQIYLIFNPYKFTLVPADVIYYIWSFIRIDLSSIIDRHHHSVVLDHYIHIIHKDICSDYSISARAIMLINYLITRSLIDILTKASLIANNCYNIIISYHEIETLIEFCPFILLDIKKKARQLLTFNLDTRLILTIEGGYKLQDDFSLGDDIYVKTPCLAAMKLINIILEIITEKILCSVKRVISSEHISFDSIMDACMTDKVVRLLYYDIFFI